MKSEVFLLLCFVACLLFQFSFYVNKIILFAKKNYRKYSRVRQWTLGLGGGKERIAIIRASGSISRTSSLFSSPSSGIVAEQLIEKIRSVRGWLLLLLEILH